MKKLRLLTTSDCLKDCEHCCNKNWDLSTLPIATHFNYDEILITGGEPLANFSVRNTIAVIKKILQNQESRPKIYIYTAWAQGVPAVLYFVNGITLTLHEQSDVRAFLKLNDLLITFKQFDSVWVKNKSFRLKIFEGVKLDSNIDLSLWQVEKDLVWVKDCPLPEGEEFKRTELI